MFLTIPQVLIGELAPPASQHQVINNTYADVRSAYGVSAYANPRWTTGSLPILKGAASELAAEVVSSLLSCIDLPTPKVLIDCRSATLLDSQAPTYRLAATCNLERTICWSLAGLGGTEFCEALLQLHGLGDTTAVVSTIQAIQLPDTRMMVGGYPLGDAVAAVVVTHHPPANEPSWQILGCKLLQLNGIECIKPHHINNLAAATCKSAGVPTSAIRWWIAQHASAAFLDCIDSTLSNSFGRHASRPHPKVNFGCADVLTTFAQTYPDCSGLGAMVFAGRFGSLSLVLLDGTV